MDLQSKRAFRFVVLFGVVSLFADMTYEAARSITGPWLAVLGASATAVGVIAGLGELIGYGLRVVSGIISDRTHRYWIITIAGYAINLLAVPAMALAGRWEIAAALIMAERMGKAVRAPAKDALLSHAAHGMGVGRAFGLHEAMDQIGAMLGPLIVAAVLAWKGSYQWGFAVLIVPALLALAVLAVMRAMYPSPEDLETSRSSEPPRALRSTFWLYLAAASCIALGFVDYPLAAFHIKTTGVLREEWIPVIYAGAMGVDAIAALVLGRLYDTKGLMPVLIVIACTAFFAPLIFLGGPAALLAGVALWGVGMGAQDSVIKAVVATIVSKKKRGTGYGIFNAGFGIAWFAGSALMGVLYDHSLVALAVFSVAAQLASLPLLKVVHRHMTV